MSERKVDRIHCNCMVMHSPDCPWVLLMYLATELDDADYDTPLFQRVWDVLEATGHTDGLGMEHPLDN